MAKVSSIADNLGWKLLGRNLGRGGQGDVELVERKSEPGGPKYAFKLLGERGGPKAKQRFRQELAALTKLNHKNIVKVVEYAQQDDGPQYYVMECIDNAKSLRQRMHQNLNLFHGQPLRAVEAFIEIVEALAACEQIGIVHRDLSPANVLVTDDGHIKLIDFGLCHIEDGNRVTLTDEAIGTPHYRPPECGGYSSKPITIKADLYSAGKILWSMITNQTAFDREKPVFNELSLSSMLPDLEMSWHCHHIFEQTIRHHPDHRFKTTADALNRAKMVQRLIVKGFKPLEMLASGVCPTCGVGNYGNAIWLHANSFSQAMAEINNILQPIRGSYGICPYCFNVAFVATTARQLALDARKQLE